MSLYPTELSKSDTELTITWSDGSQRRYTFAELRMGCPCASCREKRKADAEPAAPTNMLPVISPQEAAPTKITGMKPVGNYAYGIEFSDGHDTGIFTLERLLELGTQV